MFFKNGPFAWNGVFCFWIPLTAFAIWMVGMFLLLRNAINDEALEGQPTTAAIQPA